MYKHTKTSDKIQTCLSCSACLVWIKMNYVLFTYIYISRVSIIKAWISIVPWRFGYTSIRLKLRVQAQIYVSGFRVILPGLRWHEKGCAQPVPRSSAHAQLGALPHRTATRGAELQAEWIGVKDVCVSRQKYIKYLKHEHHFGLEIYHIFFWYFKLFQTFFLRFFNKKLVFFGEENKNT